MEEATYKTIFSTEIMYCKDVEGDLVLSAALKLWPYAAKM